MPVLRFGICWAACATALLLSACGGGSGSGGDYVAPPAAGSGTTSTVGASGYAAANLVADSAATFRTTYSDSHLVNPWGVAFNPQAFVWVANDGTSSSTLYDGNGVPQSLVVAVPPGSAGSARPTGIVFNGGPGFQVTQNAARGASFFIFAGEAGTISGWSPGVNATNAVTVVDDGAAGAVYTGLAIASRADGDTLYAADFRHRSIAVFDANFARATAAGGFADPALPAGYAPYGIQAIGGQIYVAYAQQDATGRSAAAGAGLGIVNAFDTAGTLVRRLVAPGGVLNAPWGLAMAPANFGQFSNALLVGNAGDGRINAFNPTTGALLGTLAAGDGSPIAIEGLRGIAFGNDRNNQGATTLFFAAGPGGGAHGVYGRIDSH